MMEMIVMMVMLKKMDLYSFLCRLLLRAAVLLVLLVLLAAVFLPFDNSIFLNLKVEDKWYVH